MLHKLFLGAICATMAVTAVAQPPAYRYPRPSSPVVVVTHGRDRGYSTPHDYGQPWKRTYYGLRLGLNMSNVRSDAPALDGNTIKTGLSVGAVAGTRLGWSTPLFIEGGLYYNQKGGKSQNARATSEGGKFTYDLHYLEVPLVLKYRHFTTSGVSIEPFAGGYVACGIAGNIKDYGDRRAYSSYNDGNFSRFDGGLRLGLGVGYGIGYAEVAYDLGLANVGQSDFDDTRNGCFTVSVGVNF